jgi:predicted MPP superfamily phosphohydrolase
MDSGFPPPENHRGLSRRTFMKLGAGATALAAIYPVEISRHNLQVTHHEMLLPKLADEFRGMKIVQISDLHFEEFDEAFFLEHVIEVVNGLKPDLVLCTGDIVSYGPFPISYARSRIAPCAQILSKTECPWRFASLGNHDYVVGWEHVRDGLESHGIPTLVNRAVPLERGGKRLWVVGLGSACAMASHPETAIPKSALRDGDAVVVMAHEPDILPQIASYGVDLMLSGHTHGGQIRFPMVPPMFLPTLGRVYVEGMFRLGDTHLYVNRGIGAVLVPVRFNCRPEITTFTLV